MFVVIFKMKSKLLGFRSNALREAPGMGFCWEFHAEYIGVPPAQYRMLSIPFYGAECWKITEKEISKLSSFNTTWFRKIFNIYWPRTRNNRDLIAQCELEDMHCHDSKKKEGRKWTGYVLRRNPSNILKAAVRWDDTKRGLARTTWRRSGNQ